VGGSSGFLASVFEKQNSSSQSFSARLANLERMPFFPYFCTGTS
jgi:hypothetical protein